MAQTALAILQGEIGALREPFERLAGDTLNFEKEAGFALQILTASEYATKVALNNRQSVINAVTNVAAIGVTLNPARRQAYLVPRDGKICLDISYIGLMDFATSTGAILWGQSEVVHERDTFVINGFDKPPTHGRDPFRDRGAVIGVYVVVKTRDGDYLTTCMSEAEVNAIRDRSSAWKAWLKEQKKCPWVTDWCEMAKKTVIKRAWKTWPKTDSGERMSRAIDYLNGAGGEGLDFDGGGTGNDAPPQNDFMPKAKSKQAAPPAATDVPFTEVAKTPAPAPAPPPAATAGNDEPASEGMKTNLKGRIERRGTTVEQAASDAGVPGLNIDTLTKAQFEKVMQWFNKNPHVPA